MSRFSPPGRLTPELEASWHDDGWCVVEGAIPAADLAAAQRALSHLFPTAEEMDSGVENERTTPWRGWSAAWPEFPFKSRSLNRLVVHDAVIELGERLLGTDDLRLYMALMSAKYARQPSDYNQLLHADYPNHSLLVPRQDAGYQQLELFVYLSDVTRENGATRFVPYPKTADIPVEEHTLSYKHYGELYDEPGDASGPAGSIVSYRPDVYHRSVDFAMPGASRFMLHLGLKAARVDWGGYQAWPIKGFSPEWCNFVQQATPRQLALLGFPKPGHPFWTESTVAGVNARYPGLDMGPWREALST